MPEIEVADGETLLHVKVPNELHMRFIDAVKIRGQNKSAAIREMMWDYILKTEGHRRYIQGGGKGAKRGRNNLKAEEAV